MATLLRPDPDPRTQTEKPVAPPQPEVAPEPHEFVERPRKAPDIYISRPEPGPKR
jgi:hypothetical protein